MRGNNSKQSKASNLRLVLNLITTAHPVSRAEIAKLTNLTKQTISNLIDELTNAGLVIETGIRREGVGKPSRMLELNPQGAYTLGLRIGQRKIEAGAYNIVGQALSVQSRNLTETTPEALTGVLAELCRSCLQEAAIEQHRVLGIGLVLPPPPLRRLHAEEQQSPFSNRPYQIIRRLLIAQTGLPVICGDTATAVSASEMLFGAAKELENFVYIHLGESIEAGIICNRQVHNGHKGTTGHLGHVIINTNGAECWCGNRGCLDLYASLGSLTKHLGSRLRPEDDWHQSLPTPDTHKPALESWFEQMSEPMRIALNIIENLLNPQTVILGGDVPSWFIDQFIRKLRPFIPSIAQFGERQIPRLIRAPHTEHMALRGAATLPVYSAISLDGYSSLELEGVPNITELQHLIYV